MKTTQVMRVYQGPSRELAKLTRELDRALRRFDQAQKKVLRAALEMQVERPSLEALDPLAPGGLFDTSRLLQDARDAVRLASRKMNRYRVKIGA